MPTCAGRQRPTTRPLTCFMPHCGRCWGACRAERVFSGSRKVADLILLTRKRLPWSKFRRSNESSMLKSGQTQSFRPKSPTLNLPARKVQWPCLAKNTVIRCEVLSMGRKISLWALWWYSCASHRGYRISYGGIRGRFPRVSGGSRLLQGSRQRYDTKG